MTFLMIYLRVIYSNKINTLRKDRLFKRFLFILSLPESLSREILISGLTKQKSGLTHFVNPDWNLVAFPDYLHNQENRTKMFLKV